MKNTKTTKSTSTERTFASHRFTSLTLLLLLLLLLLWGLGKLADSSTPKDPLYFLDKAYENLRASVTMSPKSRANLVLDAFNERQHEAEDLVLASDYTSCDVQSDQVSSDNDQAILTALNDSQKELVKAQAEIMQVTDASAKEELNARLVEVVGHHLIVWESMSKFVPTQIQSAVKQVTTTMIASVEKALAALPEGRRNDMIAKLQFNPGDIAATIQNNLGFCERNSNGNSNGSNGTNGANGGTSTGTSQAGGTATSGSNGTSGTTGRSGSNGTTGTSGSNGTNGGSLPNPVGNGLNINANSDAGVNVDAGIDKNNQLYVKPTISLDPNNGIDSQANVDDTNVADTNACPGPKVLGICL